MSAPDPADYARLPGDAEFLRSIPGHQVLESVPAEQRYDMARRMGLMRQQAGGTGRALVELPEGLQLGSRWRHVLTPEQIREANTRGQFAHLLNGRDPDVLAAGPVDNHAAVTAALGRDQDGAEGAAPS